MPPRKPSPAPRTVGPEAIDVGYETIDWKPVERASFSDAIYLGYALQSVRIPGAAPHPTLLVHSAAMAFVAPLNKKGFRSREVRGLGLGAFNGPPPSK